MTPSPIVLQVMDAVIVPDGRQAAVEALKESSSETRKQQMQVGAWSLSSPRRVAASPTP